MKLEERLEKEMGDNMKEYRVCIKSYLFNNSDLAEYDVYIAEDDSELEIATLKAKEMVARWTENSNGVIYELFDIEEVK